MGGMLAGTLQEDTPVALEGMQVEQDGERQVEDAVDRDKVVGVHQVYDDSLPVSQICSRKLHSLHWRYALVVVVAGVI